MSEIKKLSFMGRSIPWVLKTNFRKTGKRYFWGIPYSLTLNSRFTWYIDLWPSNHWWYSQSNCKFHNRMVWKKRHPPFVCVFFFYLARIINTCTCKIANDPVEMTPQLPDVRDRGRFLTILPTFCQSSRIVFITYLNNSIF